MLRHYRIYRYQSLITRQLSHCLMGIYTYAGACTVLLTEAADNPGQSITAASEIIATNLAARYSLDRATTRWIEHWPVETKDQRFNDEYALVSYVWQDNIAKSPSWQSLSAEEADILLGLILVPASH